MRIIIEMTETESRSTSVSREVSAQQQTTGVQMSAQQGAQDAGPPAEALLLALGSRTETLAEGTSPVRLAGARDAGEPPSWLTDVTSARGIAH